MRVTFLTTEGEEIGNAESEDDAVNGLPRSILLQQIEEASSKIAVQGDRYPEHLQKLVGR